MSVVSMTTSTIEGEENKKMIKSFIKEKFAKKQKQNMDFLNAA